MLQTFLRPCLLSSSSETIKDPEGKWYTGFPAELQKCLPGTVRLGAALVGPPGAPGSQHRTGITGVQ